MSGHSHWSSIKYKKGAADAHRGKAFSKMARVLEIAAKEGGGDPSTNSKLKIAIEQAKKLNLPKENIERAIKRGTGEIEGIKFEEILLEAYGPGKIAIIIEGITDNKNRTLSEIKQILNQYNGKLANEGSVKWLFERKGVITIDQKSAISNKNKEELELKVIEAGAEDVFWHAAPEGDEPRQGREDLLDVYTKPENLEKVKKNLEEKEIKIESLSLDWVAKEQILADKINKESLEKLFEALSENDAIQEIYSNLK